MQWFYKIKGRDQNFATYVIGNVTGSDVQLTQWEEISAISGEVVRMVW